MTDRRLTLANDRVVHHTLAHAFPALAPVGSHDHYVCVPTLDICRTPEGARDRQMVYGAAFEVLEWRGDWAFGMSGEIAPYAGWVRAGGLRPAAARPDPLFTVSRRQTHAYTEPNFKSRETMALPHGAQLCALGQEGRFTQTEVGWVPVTHLSDTPAKDPVSVAEAYLGTPYMWGGNSAFGIDCSGLVQAGLTACGTPCPGDSDQQEATLGGTLPPDTPPQRGDLMFWKGHVAWVVDAETLLHANVHHMTVAYEPLQAAITRIETQGDGPVTRHARLSSSG